MVAIRHERHCDAAEREALLDRAFGKSRRRKTAERLRAGREPARGLAFVAADGRGRIVGTLRLWNLEAGSAGPALLLGPLAVDVGVRRQGLGKRLMILALREARRLGHLAVLLVGDPSYYGRFGFSRAAAAGLRLPGPVDPARFLALELKPGALNGAEGLVIASGELAKPTAKAA